MLVLVILSAGWITPLYAEAVSYFPVASFTPFLMSPATATPTPYPTVNPYSEVQQTVTAAVQQTDTMSMILSTMQPMLTAASQTTMTAAITEEPSSSPLQAGEGYILYHDDFSSYQVGQLPARWVSRGEQSLNPTIVQMTDKEPMRQALHFPEVSWQYWDKWLLKDTLTLSNSYTVTAKLNFQTKVADRAGITIAWNDANWDRIDVQPNAYNDDIEFRVKYSGPLPSNVKVEKLAGISVVADTDYWLRVSAKDNGASNGTVMVYWSTDGTTYQLILLADGLASISGWAGVSTAGPHLPSVFFEDFSVSAQ